MERGEEREGERGRQRKKPITWQIPGLPSADIDFRDDLDLGITAVDLQPEEVVDELLVRRPEPKPQRQRFRRQLRHISPITDLPQLSQLFKTLAGRKIKLLPNPAVCLE